MKPVAKAQTKTIGLFEEFFMHSADAYLLCNTEGKITAWNRGSRYLFGYDEKEIGEYSVFTLVPGGSFDSMMHIFEAVKKDRVILFESHCVTNEGRVFDGEITCGLLKAGKEPLIYMCVRDVSNLGKYRDKLRTMSMFPDSTGDFILEWEKEHGITYFNQAVKNFLSSNGNSRLKPENVLPRDYEKHMEKLVGTQRTLRQVEANLSGRTMSYTFIPYETDDRRVMILGRDVSGTRQLESEIDSAYDRTRNILNLIEGILREMRFMDLEEEMDVRPAVQHFIRDSSDHLTHSPSHVFVARENPEGMLLGTLFVKKHGEIQPVSLQKTFHPLELRRLTSDRSDMFYTNWDPELQDRENFKETFPEFFIENITNLKNYVTCRINGDPGGLMVAFNYPGIISKYDSETIRGLAVALGAMFSTRSQFGQKVEAQFTLIAKMAELVEERDQETGEHLRRVANYSRIIADEMSRKPRYKDVITVDFIKKLYRSAPLHDLGKVGVSDAVLQKPGKLNDREYEIMQKHTIIGGKLLEGPKFLEMARDIAYFHHEKFDGSGYPYGMRGYEIPLAARIVAIADVYDAMTSDRVYKEAFSHDRTKKLISICSGGHFDPDVVESFMTREQDFIKVREMYRS